MGSPFLCGASLHVSEHPSVLRDVLRGIPLCCKASHRAAGHPSLLRGIPLCCRASLCAVGHPSVFQSISLCCRTSLCAAKHPSVLRDVPPCHGASLPAAGHPSVLRGIPPCFRASLCAAGPRFACPVPLQGENIGKSHGLEKASQDKAAAVTGEERGPEEQCPVWGTQRAPGGEGPLQM